MAAQNTPPTTIATRSLPAPPPKPSSSNATPPGKDKAGVKPSTSTGSFPFWFGLAFSIGWIVSVFFILARSGPTHTFGGLPLVDWAIGVSAMVSPIAMVWMVCAYVQRAADIKSVADPLRRQLAMVTGESGAAEARIRRFNQAIREQIELLKNTQTISQNDLTAIVDRMRHQREDMQQFDQASMEQVREIQDIIRRNMQQVENMMDDKFTMLRVLDDKLMQNGNSVARQAEGVHDQLAKLLEEVEAQSQKVADALSQAMRDSKKLSDTSHAQETSLTTAAESAAETLDGLSSKIDLSVARFLERASSAREEAERLAGALDTQTRSLEEFSSTLPGRVSEAETVIRGVADRLYASEQLAREQAVSLSEKLSAQVDGLQSFMDRFSARVSDIDGGLETRRKDLDAMTNRMSTSATDFSDAWEKSIIGLNERANEVLARYTALNGETRRDADAVADHLTQTTEKYESVAVRTHKLTEQSGEHMKSLTAEIAAHLSQFESLNKASNDAGQELQSRSSAAMQNLQQVLDRLLEARDATKTVGESLVKDLTSAASQNEQLIGRLNEAAQMSVRALGIATESLGKQEGELADRTRAAEAMLKEAAAQLQQQAQVSEKGLREQAKNLMEILGETKAQMNTTTDQMSTFAARAVPPIQDVLRQIEGSANQNMQAVGKYGESLQEQIIRLQQFHSKVGGMGEDLTRITTDTLTSIEQLNGRFIAVRTVQDETARKTIDQFVDLSDRLQKEVSGLDAQTAQAVASLQQAAARVGEQSFQLLHDAENSGAKMQIVTSALQNEASQIRSILQKQADDLSADLNRAEKQFGTLGDALKQRTDAAYDLLDRVAAHYNETTRAAAQEIDNRTQRLEQITAQAQTKVEALSGTLQQQLSLLGDGSTQFEVHASQIGSMSGKALQQLTALNEKFAVTYEAATNNSRQALTRLDECNTAFMRQGNSLAEAAQTSVTLIQKAGATFGEQAGKMMETGQQIDQSVRQLSSTTSTLAEQSNQIRTAMEQQNQRLVSQLTDAVAQIESAGNRLNSTATSAMSSADEAAVRFEEMTQSASSRLGASQQEMQTVASKAESALTTLGTNVTQQAATLSIIGEQLTDQFHTISAANENQRTQLVDLFDKLGAAHSQASEVADRTIVRLTEALNQIQRNLGAMSDQSQTAVSNVREASSGFADQSGILLQNAQQAEQQARAVLTVTSALQDQARQLREALHGESERAGEVLGGLISKLSAGGMELREMSSSTEMSLNGLNNTITQQSQGLTSTMQQIVDRQRSLTTALDAQRDVLNGLLGRLNIAQDETASVAERTASRLTEGAQQITRQIETLSTQADNALSTVQAAGAGFATEAGTLSQNAQNAEMVARNLSSTTATLQDQARQSLDALQGESERTGTMLSGLLTKISTGGNDLREMSLSTETSLNSLHNNVNEQIQNLAASITQINDRQRSLTVGLDAQRDVLSDLLQRLNVAQDETAATAERTASRLTDGTQQITRQLESMNTQAQSTLSGVQAAGSGFANESDRLSQNAQAAEQQVRSILSSTAALQDQARQLSEALHGETERTNEVLSSLLGKLTAGGGDLREMSAATTLSLSEMQSGISEQVQALASSMQQISDRQRTLTTALDAQRDVLNGLLSRLNMAQDETAAVAERTAARLTDGAAQITRQIETIGAQAQTALTSVQAAGAGFADEAGALNLQAQQAEQQMRGVLSVTAGMQDQARQLREAMQSETARVIEQLNNAIAQLDNAGSHLKTESGSAVYAMDQVALQFTAVVRSGSESMSAEAALLTQTAEMAEGRIAQAGEKLREHMKVIGDAGDQTELQARQLADSAEYATNRLVTLRSTIVDSDKDGQTTLAQASARVAEVKLALQAELQRLTEMSQVAVQQVMSASDSLAAESDALRVNLAMSESALAQAAILVRDESGQVPATLDRSAAHIEAATQALKAQAEAADKTLIGTADRFISVTTTARQSMVEEMQRISATADEADQALRQYNKTLSEQASVMQGSIATMAGEQDSLVLKASESVVQLSAASDRLAELRKDAAQTAARLAHEFDALDKRTAVTGQSLMQAGDAVAKNMDVLAQTAQRAESQMLGASSQFREQFERIRAGLQGQIDDINRGLMQITAQLERTGNMLRSTTVGSVADVERVAQRFEQTSKEAGEQLVDKTGRMRGATEEVAKMLSGFGDQLDVLLDRLAMAGDGIRRQEGSIVGQLDTALTHLGSVVERLEAGRALAANVSDQATARLGEVVETIQEEMQNLTTGSQTAAGILRGIGQIYGEQTQTLNSGVREAHTQVLSMNKSIDEMQKRADRMRVSLKLQGEDLMSSLSSILKQLQDTGDNLDQASLDKLAGSLKRMN